MFQDKESSRLIFSAVGGNVVAMNTPSLDQNYIWTIDFPVAKTINLKPRNQISSCGKIIGRHASKCRIVEPNFAKGNEVSKGKMFVHKMKLTDYGQKIYGKVSHLNIFRVRIPREQLA